MEREREQERENKSKREKEVCVGGTSRMKQRASLDQGGSLPEDQGNSLVYNEIDS